jgi:hypothetical protein
MIRRGTSLDVPDEEELMPSNFRTIDPKLLCRLLGHAWFPIPAEKATKYGDAMSFRCERCDTERHDDVGRGNGELYGRRYVYQDGYQHHWDDMFTQSPTRSDFRMMMLEVEDRITKARQTRKAHR